MIKKGWEEFVFKQKGYNITPKFPGYKIRNWYYINIYQRKWLKENKKSNFKYQKKESGRI